MAARYHRYTEEHNQFIFENYKGRSTNELTEMFNQRFSLELTAGQMKGFLARNKLKNGYDARFLKGLIPHNKGKKGHNSGKETQFKKGRLPHNHRPVGTERFSKEGYVEVKVADPSTWKKKHHIVWEKVNGAVPKGHLVIFADGDKYNFDIDNLVLITKKQNAIMNRMKLRTANGEMIHTSILLADVIGKLRERELKQNGGKNK